jgi:uncharacterized radical SAM superfamily Fe-S cluster-containing enzyme
MKAPTMPLSKKQKLFADLYATLNNATEAAKQAGYSPVSASTTGYRMLRQPQIKEYIAQLESSERERLLLDKDSYIAKTYKLFESEQNPQVKKQYWEALGKASGFFETNVNRTTNNFLAIEGMDPLTLIETISKIRSKYKKVKEIEHQKLDIIPNT